MLLVAVLKLGLQRYAAAAEFQNVLVQKLKKQLNISGYLLLLEHPHVYTTGLRGNSLSYEDEIKLKSLGADVCRVSRGGLVTYHGPGQLVIWPLLNLKSISTTSVRRHISALERTVIMLCGYFNINAKSDQHYPGVWADDAKICAIGIQMSRYITSHGLALNACTDLSWYDHIVPCGITDRRVTSLSHESNKIITVEEAASLYLKCFSEVFNCNLIEIPLDSLSCENNNLENLISRKKIQCGYS